MTKQQGDQQSPQLRYTIFSDHRSPDANTVKPVLSGHRYPGGMAE